MSDHSISWFQKFKLGFKKTLVSLPTILMIFLVGLFLVGTFSLGNFAWSASAKWASEVPGRGGALTEGVLGNPRFINPLLSSSKADRELVNLIYSGLMRKTADGELIPDLALSYEISEDKKEYTFLIKPNATWHDGKEVTAGDIVYTINTLKDPIIKSPKAVSWEGVEVESLGPEKIIFRLSKPFPDFLSLTTLGIVPKHLWQDIEPSNIAFDDLNSEPIGSGPYKIKKVKASNQDTNATYDLRSFKDFTLGQPMIKKIVLKFYEDEKALVEGYEARDVDNISGINPDLARELELSGQRIITTPLPRVFGLFFNQNKNNLFIDKTVREALDLAVDKEALVKKVLAGYGTVLNGPLSPRVRGYEAVKSNRLDPDARAATSFKLLSEDGWTKNDEGILVKKTGETERKLALTITTADAPELLEVAETIKSTWTSLGVEVTIKTLSSTELTQQAIRPRDYEVLLFGMVIGENPDLYSFWHSSKRLDPGLNVAIYTDIKTDNLLEELTATTDQAKKNELTRAIQDQIVSKTPAVFLYSPYFIYLTSNKIENVDLSHIDTASDRFNSIYKWYIEKDRVWNVFLKKKNDNN